MRGYTDCTSPVRCTCLLPIGAHGTWMGTERADPTRCAIHGPASKDPRVPYHLTYMDKQQLRKMGIGE